MSFPLLKCEERPSAVRFGKLGQIAKVNVEDNARTFSARSDTYFFSLDSKFCFQGRLARPAFRFVLVGWRPEIDADRVRILIYSTFGQEFSEESWICELIFELWLFFSILSVEHCRCGSGRGYRERRGSRLQFAEHREFVDYSLHAAYEHAIVVGVLIPEHLLTHPLKASYSIVIDRRNDHNVFERSVVWRKILSKQGALIKGHILTR